MQLVATEQLEVSKLSTEQLKAELARELGSFANHLIRLAAVWVELERRGEDLTQLRGGIGVYLPAIAAGTVLPETVVRFSGQTTLLRAIAALTPTEQQRILDDGKVLVAERKNGHHETRMLLPVAALSTAQIRLVFAERSIRNETEQVAILYSPPPQWKPVKKSGRIRAGRITVDRTTEQVLIGKSAASIEEMLMALRDAGIIPA